MIIIYICLLIVFMIGLRYLYKLILSNLLYHDHETMIVMDTLDDINEEYYHKIKKNIDKTTFYDLELDEVFKVLNQTYTSIGREYMYGRMFIDKPNDLIEEVTRKLEDVSLLRKTIYELYNLSKEYNPVLDIFDHKHIFDKKNMFMITFSLLIFMFILLFHFLIDIGLKYLGLWLVMHIFLYSHIIKNTYDLLDKTESYCYMIKTFERILKLGVYDNKLKKIIIPAKKYTYLYRSYYHISKIDILHIFDIISSLTCMLFFQCYILEKKKEELKEDLLIIYEYIGLLDTAIAIKKVQKHYQTCIPKVSQEKKIDFINCYHPLVKEPVKNSLTIKDSMIITGSNASGKSTFLKMIGVNMICAKAFHICFADQFIYYPLCLITSIHMKDSLIDNESYYVSEIKRLKLIIDKAKTQDNIIMIDEILRGTNEKERMAISKVILEKLFSSHSLIIVTTHDLYIADYFKYIDHYCFSEHVKNGTLCLDYKIHKGVSRVGNAIKLLEIYEYDKDIIERLKKNKD